MNRYIIYTTLAILISLAGIKVISGEFTYKEYSEFYDNIVVKYYMKAYKDVSEWPTEEERKKLLAKDEDIKECVSYFKKYADFLLNDKYIPDDIEKHVYGLYKWPGTGDDTLFAEWNIKECKIRVIDEPDKIQIRIKSDDFPNKPDNMKNFIEDNIKEYFKESGNILKYKTMNAYLNTRFGTTRIRVRMPGNIGTPEQFPWVNNNPPMWYFDKTFVLVFLKKWVIRKLAINNYGMSQRFPHISKYLKNKTTVEIAHEYLSDKRNRIEKHAIIDIIWERDDISLAIDPILSEWENNKTLRLTQDLAGIVRKSGDIEKIKTIKKLIDDEIESNVKYNKFGELEAMSSRLQKRINELSTENAD